MIKKNFFDKKWTHTTLLQMRLYTVRLSENKRKKWIKVRNEKVRENFKKMYKLKMIQIECLWVSLERNRAANKFRIMNRKKGMEVFVCHKNSQKTSEERTAFLTMAKKSVTSKKKLSPLRSSAGFSLKKIYGFFVVVKLRKVRKSLFQYTRFDLIANIWFLKKFE